jgi:hypothetical protein
LIIISDVLEVGAQVIGDRVHFREQITRRLCRKIDEHGMGEAMIVIAHYLHLMRSKRAALPHVTAPPIRLSNRTCISTATTATTTPAAMDRGHNISFEAWRPRSLRPCAFGQAADEGSFNAARIG